MWGKGCAALVGLTAVLGFGWVSAQETGGGYYGGASYVLKAGDFVNWPSGHGWYFRIASTSSNPLKVTTTNSSGKAIYAQAPSGGYAVYASGRMAAKSLKYTTPRTHHLIVGSAAFDTVSDSLAYSKSELSSGGAWFTTAGDHFFVAAINLPDGAVITGLTGHFYDASTATLNAQLFREPVDGNYQVLATAASSGSPGYTSTTTTAIANPVVDNQNYAYEVDAWSTGWDGTSSLRIKAIEVTYTINEAP